MRAGSDVYFRSRETFTLGASSTLIVATATFRLSYSAAGDVPMRVALLLLIAFVAIFTAWVRIGSRAIAEAWDLYDAASDDFFSQPGSSAAVARRSGDDSARTEFMRLYLGGLGAVLADESSPGPRARTARQSTYEGDRL